jgi:DNA-binding MurR/RpiR family transcriptional regulator
VEELITELMDVKLNLANVREILKKEIGTKERVRHCYVAQAYINAAIENIQETIDNTIEKQFEKAIAELEKAREE